MIQIERDPVFAELDALCVSPWASIPRTRIPQNWREIEPGAYNLSQMQEEAARSMKDLPGELRLIDPLALAVLYNQRVRVAKTYKRACKKHRPKHEKLEVNCQELRQRMMAKRRRAA